MDSNAEGGYVVTERFGLAMRASAEKLGQMGDRPLTPLEAAILEHVGDLWSATMQAIMELEVRLGPTKANPAGHAALKEFAAKHGIEIA